MQDVVQCTYKYNTQALAYRYIRIYIIVKVYLMDYIMQDYNVYKCPCTSSDRSDLCADQ